MLVFKVRCAWTYHICVGSQALLSPSRGAAKSFLSLSLAFYDCFFKKLHEVHLENSSVSSYISPIPSDRSPSKLIIRELLAPPSLTMTNPLQLVATVDVWNSDLGAVQS